MTQPSGLRVFLSSAVFSFRAQFSWLNPPMWVTMKLILPFSQMAFFCLLGEYLVLEGFAGPDIVAYMAIGNAVQAMSWNTVFAVINITSAVEVATQAISAAPTPVSLFQVNMVAESVNYHI